VTFAFRIRMPRSTIAPRTSEVHERPSTVPNSR
jgi:hypothetical protein